MDTGHHARMFKVLAHIQDIMDADMDDEAIRRALAPERLARVACFSASHFHRWFKGMVGESLGEHLRRLRLERAALRLFLTDRAVTELGLEAGYETSESFSRAFRKMFDVPPSRYREIERSRRLPHASSGVHYLPEAERPGLTFKPRSMNMDVDIRNIPATRVAYMRHVGPYFEVGKAWEKLCSWAGPKGLITPDTKFYGLCWDDPQVTPPDKIRADVCLTIAESVEPEGEAGTKDIFDGDWAVYRHEGPYEGLAEAYENLFGVWLPGSGRELRDGASVECYLNDPRTTPPEKLLTDIHIPLK